MVGGDEDFVGDGERCVQGAAAGLEAVELVLEVTRIDEPPARMGFGLSSRFFSILLSLRVGSEPRLVMVLIEASAKPTWFRSDPRLVPFIFGRTRPASSYPAEREALNHHALVRQGAGDQGGRSKSVQRR